MLADIRNLKALGANFVRGAHYPQASRFLDLCDEHGLLVWEETLGWGNGAADFANPAFLADNLAQARLMVEKSFNHPSVVLFGFLNEFDSDTPAARPEISGFTVWQLADCRSFHRDGGAVRCKPFAENLAGIYDGYRRPKLPVVAAVRDAFRGLP